MNKFSWVYNKKPVIVLMAAAVFTAVFILGGISNAQTNSGDLPGVVEGTSTEFTITDSQYLNVSLVSSEEINLRLESTPKIITMTIRSVSAVTSTQITISGFIPLITYYKYEDNFHNLQAFTTNENGQYSYTQDLSKNHFIIIQTKPSTKFIKDDTTGGDCISIGNWDPVGKICTLTTDVNQIIEIDNDGIILDGNGHTLDDVDAGTYAAGVYAYGRKNIIVKNLNIKNFNKGVMLSSVLYGAIRNIAITGSGIYLNGDNNEISNDIITPAPCGVGMQLYNARGNLIVSNTINGTHCPDWWNKTYGVLGNIIQNNIFSNNLIQNNDVGISFSYYIHNSVYNNNFVNNATPVYLEYDGGYNLFSEDLPVGGNYWSNFSTVQQGCSDANNDNICDSPYGGFSGIITNPDYKDYYPWKIQDGWKISVGPQEFWAEVDASGESLKIQDKLGLQGLALKTIPNGWVVKVIKTMDSNNNFYDQDGFRWYQIQDTTDGIIGWLKDGILQDGKVVNEYLPYIFSKQSDFEEKANKKIIDIEERKSEIIKAIDNYYSNIDLANNLYSGAGGDGNNNFQSFIRNFNFPENLILAIAAQESGPSFNNEICSGARDGGIGVMQITTLDSKGKGSGLIDYNNQHDCEFDWIGVTSAYYSNSSQGIYANIKDGFRVLQDKAAKVKTANSFSDNNINISLPEMQTISTAYRYNQGSPFMAQAAFEVWNRKDHWSQGDADYVWNEYLKHIRVYSDESEALLWMKRLLDVCSASLTFEDCLENANVIQPSVINGDPLYLKHLAAQLRSSSFGVDYQNEDLAAKLEYVNNHKVIVALGSPGELSILDSKGRRTGLINNQIKEEIPNTFYDADQNSIVMLTPQDDLKYEVKGTEQGTYVLVAESENNNRLVSFNGIDIPISPNEIHAYGIDWQSLADGKQGVTLSIDSNGDGVVDRTIQAGKELVDITPPQINAPVLNKEYIFGFPLALQFSAIDDKSGIASLTALLNGSSIMNNQTVILSKPGFNSFQVIAKDNVGNVSTSSQTFNVSYKFSGFQSPPKGASGGIYRLGINLPIKFQLFDVKNIPVTSAIAKLYATRVFNGITIGKAVAVSSSATNSGNIFRYDYKSNQYVFDLNTGSFSVGTWRFQIVLDDIKNYYFDVSLNK